MPNEEFLRHCLEFYKMVPKEKFPQLFNTLKKGMGYLVDTSLPELTLADIESSGFNRRPVSNNVINFADYKKSTNKRSSQKS